MRRRRLSADADKVLWRWSLSDSALTMGILDWLFDRTAPQDPRRKRRVQNNPTNGEDNSALYADFSQSGSDDPRDDGSSGHFDHGYDGGESGGGGASGDWGGGDSGGGDSGGGDGGGGGH